MGKIYLDKNVIGNLEKLKNGLKIVKNKVLPTTILVPTLLMSGCTNRRIFDTNYGFNEAIIKGDDSTIILEVKEWKDYPDGEQLQFVTDDSFVLLTSTFDTDIVYGKSDFYSANKLASNGISDEGEIHKIGTEKEEQAIYNKTLIDTRYAFNKMFIHNNNNGIILPINQWRDYEGEQLQVITDDGLVVVGSSYNTNLINDSTSEIKANEYANSYLGSDGKLTDLSSNKDKSSINFDIFDSKYTFNKAIIFKDKKAVILPIDKWADYEGEQLQLNVHNGPTILTAAYDTLIICDNDSEIKAKDVAESLAEEVVDYAEDYKNTNINYKFLDFEYGFGQVLISGKDSSYALHIDSWRDYDGEQLQIKTKDNDIILGSSMMLDFINGGTEKINAEELGKDYVSDSNNAFSNLSNKTNEESYNKQILDTSYRFNYALKINDGNVVIIPLKKWRDYNIKTETEDSEKVYKAEEFQLILPDDSVMITTAYNTVLVNTNDINRVAQYFKGAKGKITNLTDTVGEPDTSLNFSFFDTKYYFDKIIYTNGNSSQIVPIEDWLDFADGEQLQVRFTDGSGLLTSYVNTTLIKSETEGLEEKIANGLVGESEKGKVKIYN